MAEFQNDEQVLEASKRKAKQRYLQEEILEAGFDPEQFTEYVGKLKGADVDDYTFDELQEVCEGFIIAVRDNTLHLTPQLSSAAKQETKVLSDEAQKLADSDTGHRMSYIAEMDNEQAVEQTIDGDEIEEEEKEENQTAIIDRLSQAPDGLAGTKTTIKGIPAPGTQLAETQALKCNIVSQEIISGGMFSSSYVLFDVNTEPMQWNVKRRYTDFSWLRERLSQQFPGVYIPPIPSKKSRGRLQESFLLRRKFTCEQFLNQLLCNPLLKRSISVEMFLKEPSPKIFETFQKEQLRKPATVAHFQSITGDIPIDLTEGNKEDYYKMGNFLTTAESLNKKMKQLSAQLIREQQAMSNTIFNLSETMKKLEEAYEQFPDFTAQQQTYRAAGKTFEQWGKFEAERIKDVYESITRHFSFHRKSTSSFKALLKVRDTHEAALLKQDAKLTAKKEKLWASGDQTKWGITSDEIGFNPERSQTIKKMLPKETNACEQLRLLFGYYNHHVWQEFLRDQQDLAVLENQHFSQFADRTATHIIDLHMAWSTMLKAKCAEIQFELIPDAPHLTLLVAKQFYNIQLSYFRRQFEWIVSSNFSSIQIFYLEGSISPISSMLSRKSYSSFHN